MNTLSAILTNLQAAIAAGASRERHLTVLLVAVWARVARMRTRLERLIGLWRAGKLPRVRARRDETARVRAAGLAPRVRYPTMPGWLRRKLGYEIGAYAGQLQHLLTQAEGVAFLAAVPQAGRILRPLLRMVTADPLPEVVRLVRPVVAPVASASGLIPAGLAAAPGSQKLDD